MRFMSRATKLQNSLKYFKSDNMVLRNKAGAIILASAFILITAFYYLTIRRASLGGGRGPLTYTTPSQDGGPHGKNIVDYVISLGSRYKRVDQQGLTDTGTEIQFHKSNSWITLIPREVYVYSAFFDPSPLMMSSTLNHRGSEPLSPNFLGVKMVAITRLRRRPSFSFLNSLMIGLSNLLFKREPSNPELVCVIRMAGSGKTLVVAAILSQLPEHHDFDYTSTLIYCPIHRSEFGSSAATADRGRSNALLDHFPIAVTVVPVRHPNVSLYFPVIIPNSAILTPIGNDNRESIKSLKLAISTVSPNSPNGAGTVAVCIPPIFSPSKSADSLSKSVDRSREVKEESRRLLISILQTIEWDGYFGADRLNFYLTREEVDPGVIALLHHYNKVSKTEEYPNLGRSSISIRAWDLPRHLVGRVHYNGQVASIQDCLFRSSNNVASVLLFHDLDELLFPLTEFSFRDLFVTLAGTYPPPLNDAPIDGVRICGYSFRNIYYGPALLSKSAAILDDSTTSGHLSKSLSFRASNQNRTNKVCGSSPGSFSLPPIIPAIEWRYRTPYNFPHTIRSKLALLGPGRTSAVGIHELTAPMSRDSAECLIYHVPVDVAIVKHFTSVMAAPEATWNSRVELNDVPGRGDINAYGDVLWNTVANTSFYVPNGVFQTVTMSGPELVLYGRIWHVLETLLSNSSTSPNYLIRDLLCHP